MASDSFALVTGGAGFIGYHLIDELLKRGEKVVCLDNLFTGKKENIEDLKMRHSGGILEFIQCDINYLPTPSQHPSLHRWKLHMIYNLACPASPVHYQKNPVETVRTNVVGTTNMLDFALARDVTFLQASTSEVYGDPEIHPQVETYVGHVNPIGPRACYDEGKRCAETLCSDFTRQHGLVTKIARIFNTYGPRMAENDGRVVSNFIVQALKGEPLTIFGDGSQTRSFQYVTDLVKGLLALAEHPTFHGPVNIGTQHEFTVLDLAKMIIKMTGSKSKIVRKPLPQDDPKQRRPDTTVARRELGWEQSVSVEDGLKETIAYFRDLAS